MWHMSGRPGGPPARTVRARFLQLLHSRLARPPEHLPGGPASSVRQRPAPSLPLHEEGPGRAADSVSKLGRRMPSRVLSREHLAPRGSVRVADCVLSQRWMHRDAVT